MVLTKIESAVRSAGGVWSQYFRREGGEWQCILLPAERLSEEQYAALSRRFTPSYRSGQGKGAGASGG